MLYPVGLKHLSLDFAYGNIGDGGARAVAEHIPEGLTQLYLDFGFCNIGEAALGAVADAAVVRGRRCCRSGTKFLTD